MGVDRRRAGTPQPRRMSRFEQDARMILRNHAQRLEHHRRSVSLFYLLFGLVVGFVLGLVSLQAARADVAVAVGMPAAVALSDRPEGPVSVAEPSAE